MMEEWRALVEFPDYAVSSLGQVKRVVEGQKGSMPKVLRPWITNKGYAIVTLFGKDGAKRKQISRLVCEAFHGPPPTSDHQAAHGDGDPSNNAHTNLRWASRAENMADCLLHGTRATGARHGRSTKPERNPRGELHGGSKLTTDDVIAIRAHPKTTGSGRKLAAQFGVTPPTICLIRAGKTWSHV